MQTHQLAFDFSPVAQLIFCPFTDEIYSANRKAHSLFHQTNLVAMRPSQLFAECFDQLLVLTDQALTEGSAISENLFFSHERLVDRHSLETQLQKILIDQRCLLVMALQDLSEMHRRRDIAEANQHYNQGFFHWTRTAKVFQEFERENRLLLDAAGEGIYGVDANGLTTFLNPAAERILGWKAKELQGKNMHYTIHAHHKDGHHYPVMECPIYRAFREGVVNFVDDEVFWSKEGTPISVEYTSTPIKDGNEVVGAVIIFRDVTEKKLAQKKLLEALNEVDNLRQRLEMENAYLQEEISSEFNNHQFVGKSIAVRKIHKKIELVAPTEATVLINGESGTGKELIARAIHDLSDRSQRSLIRVNCAAIPNELFESEFFGHVKGAFTGANSDRPGRFELADGGTLFLDEVGEIPLALQGKLLRVLQEQQFERVGEAKTRKVDVRIIAATNRDLPHLIERGEFREDLYFRLNVFPIESVPLRERIDDIPLLAQHFLRRASTRAKKSGLKIPLSQIEVLSQYPWPGNVRELENIIERQVILAQGSVLRFDDLGVREQAPNHSAKPSEATMTEEQRREAERNNIVLALKTCEGKVFGENGAAALLGIKPTTLASRIKRFAIKPEVFKKSFEAS